MRLHGLSNEIMFDEFEEYPLITLKVFISSMLNMEMLFIPKYFSVKIYTSKTIYKQMNTYWKQKKEDCLRLHNFVVLKPNEPTKVPLDLSDSVEVCMFESEDVNKNVMFMFRTGNKTTHVYAGVVTEFRCFVFNNIFKEWVCDGVGGLYVDISRAMCLDERDPRELNNAIEGVEEILESNPDYTLMINMPRIGYENFVYNLAEHLRARVSIGGIMFAVFTILKKMEYFVPNAKDAKILIVNKCFTLEEMKSSFQKRKYIFIKITDKLRIVENKTTQQQSAFYEINWSPLPSDFDLQLLAKIVKPNRIYPIHHESSATQLSPQVPNYLLQLCKDYAQIVEEIQKSKSSEKQVLEELFSIKSSCELSSESASNDYVMKLTQDRHANSETERTKRVSDWLNAENVSNPKSDQDTTIINEPSTTSVHIKETIKPNRNSLRTKICSSISKSLEQAHPISKSPKLTSNDEAYKNSFCIPKRSIHYLENSDSSS